MVRKSAYSRTHLGVEHLFKIGIGPSSSHTVGPMVAAVRFLKSLRTQNIQPAHIQVFFHGSLAFTGKGHASDTAVILGLCGFEPHTTNPDMVEQQISKITQEKHISISDNIPKTRFNPVEDIVFDYINRMPQHSNGMQFFAYDGDNQVLLQNIYYSIGGGFVVSDAEISQNEPSALLSAPPLVFDSADELLALCEEHNKSIAEVMMENELAYHSKDYVWGKIDDVWKAMQDCMDRGLSQRGYLPGRMNVKRRAADLCDKMNKIASTPYAKPTRLDADLMDYVNIWAIAVNEENAAGGRVVTAPTNGAAGIIPAVARYCQSIAYDKHMYDFFLTATAIGSLYKKNASISGAEAGCQGEVGVACSMAAAGLAAQLGGTPQQVENAAEIGMEHNLGLTCDPIGGMVQIPCIERNAMGSIKAINAARLALRGDGKHYVSLDNVIETMRQTGLDMAEKYKETSQGGLAVNVPEC